MSHFIFKLYKFKLVLEVIPNILSLQIADQFKGLGGPVSLKISVIVGGIDRLTQCKELSKSPHVVVATPGRLADILDSAPEFTLKR